jgi:hypothetical protein
MIDERLIEDVDLAARDQRRHRDDHREVARLAVKIVGHRHDSAIGVADDDHLRGAIEELRVALRYIETAEGVGVGCDEEGKDDEAADHGEPPFQTYRSARSRASMIGTSSADAASDHRIPFVRKSLN